MPVRALSDVQNLIHLGKDAQLVTELASGEQSDLAEMVIAALQTPEEIGQHTELTVKAVECLSPTNLDNRATKTFFRAVTSSGSADEILSRLLEDKEYGKFTKLVEAGAPVTVSHFMTALKAGWTEGMTLLVNTLQKQSPDDFRNLSRAVFEKFQDLQSSYDTTEFGRILWHRLQHLPLEVLRFPVFTDLFNNFVSQDLCDGTRFSHYKISTAPDG